MPWLEIGIVVGGVGLVFAIYKLGVALGGERSNAKRSRKDNEALLELSERERAKTPEHLRKRARRRRSRRR